MISSVWECEWTSSSRVSGHHRVVCVDVRRGVVRCALIPSSPSQPTCLIETMLMGAPATQASCARQARSDEVDEREEERVASHPPREGDGVDVEPHSIIVNSVILQLCIMVYFDCLPMLLLL